MIIFDIAIYLLLTAAWVLIIFSLPEMWDDAKRIYRELWGEVEEERGERAA